MARLLRMYIRDPPQSADKERLFRQQWFSVMNYFIPPATWKIIQIRSHLLKMSGVIFNHFLDISAGGS